MTREEQIKEISEIIADYVDSKDGNVRLIRKKNAALLAFSHNAGIAKALFDAGYRKGKPNELQAVAHDCGK